MGAIQGIIGFIGGMHQKLQGAELGRAVALVGQKQSLATAGAGTLTAALLAPGGVIQRTGPTGAYAETLATGALMDAEYPEIEVGQSFRVTFSNRVAYIATLTAATGMTAVAGSVVAIPASVTVDIILTKTGVATWTFEV